MARVKGNKKLMKRKNEEWLIYDRLIIVGIFIKSCMNDGGQQGVKVDTIEKKKKVFLVEKQINDGVIGNDDGECQGRRWVEMGC